MWHGPYAEIPPRTPTGVCLKCRKTFEHSHRRVPLFIVSTIASHPSGAGRALYVCRIPEFKHPDCSNPNNRMLIKPALPRRNIFPKMNPDMLPDIEPRVPCYVCAGACKKVFEAGDRVLQVLIIQGTVRDPITGAVESVASPNFEVVHDDCSDPKLAGLASGLVLG